MIGFWGIYAKCFCWCLCLFTTVYLSAQSQCHCSNTNLIKDIDQTPIEDSVSVYNLAAQLNLSSEKACNFLAINLEINFLLDQEEMERAETLLIRQNELLKQLSCEEELLATFNLNQAKFYHSKNDYEYLSKYALEALVLAEKSKNLRLEIEALKELVWLYTRIDEDEKLWTYVARAEKLILKNDVDKLYAIYDYRWLGYQYESQYVRTNDKALLDKALLYVLKAKKAALSHQHITELTKIYRALEAISYHEGKLENALSYIDTAIYYGKQIKGRKNLSGLYLSKAWDHLDLGQFAEAEKWTDTMLVCDTKADIGGYMMTLSQAAELYEESGSLNKAFQAFKRHAALKDSILNIERLKAINELETKYQTELKDKELKIKNARIKRLTIYIILCTASLVFLLLLLKINQLRKVKKMNADLEKAMETQAKLEQEIIQVKENIAQDFHDELGNKLARISLLSNLIKADKSLKNEGIKSKLIQITEDAKTLYLGTRDFIFSLKTNSDQLEEVITYLSDFGEDYFSKTSIQFQLEKSIEKDIRLPFYWSKQLIFIFKEAMTNALKHSNCSKVKLRFYFSKQDLQIELEDDGKGIADAVLNSNNGLNNMRQRAKKIGAYLSIDTQAKHGTKISFMGKLPNRVGI